jgi:hypothetical protein
MCNMAKQVQTRLVDDTDGSEAAETVAFQLDGKSWELDLSKKNAKKLRKALEPFVAAARRAGRGSRVRQRGSGGASHTASERDRNAAIREWARRKGHQVANRGRIPASVIEAYEKQAGRS